MTETAGPGTLVPLLGLAPDGVCLASDVTTGAVSSYLAVSPLPLPEGRGGMFLWHFPSGHPAPPLAGILPGGARTFLPPSAGRARGKDGGRPVTLSRPHFSMGLTPVSSIGGPPVTIANVGEGVGGAAEAAVKGRVPR